MEAPLAKDFPPWKTVYDWFRRFRIDGTWERESAVRAVRQMSTFDSREWLGQISCPTFVICGSQDMAASSRHCEMIARGIKKTLLRVFHDAGHTLPWTHQEQLVEQTERWLSTTSPGYLSHLVVE